MRVFAVLSSFFLGASLADVDFDNKDCVGDACFLRNQVMNVDRSKTDPTTKLAYNERSLAYVNTQNLLAVCLPGVSKESAADSFTSCTGRPMEEICVFAKRKWLVKDAQDETVADLAFLSTAFSGLAGGDEAVKKCMKIKEEEEATDDYYTYEYDYDYYDYYDYLEEAGGIEVRRKREAGKGDKNGGKGGKNKKNNPGKGKKGDKKDTRKGKNGGKNSTRKGKGGGKSTKGKGTKNTTKGGKRNGKKEKKSKGNKKGKKSDDKKENERKFLKPSKKPSKDNTANTNAKLNILGFLKMPTKSTLIELECLWDELEDLLVKCGEKVISSSP